MEEEKEQGFVFTLQLTGHEEAAQLILKHLLWLATIFDGLECLGFTIQDKSEGDDGST